MAARTSTIDAQSLEVRITAMRRRHLRSVLRIENEVYPRPWSLGLFMSELAIRTGRIYLVARVGTSVVGYSGMLFSIDDGHVTTIAVDPVWHRGKIGTRLLLHLLRQGIAKGAKNFTLEVRVSNEGAQALYRHFGFAPAGVRKGYYIETNEDAIVMWAHDVDQPHYLARLDAIEAAIPGHTIVDILDG
ncbi:MAG TPA: ribosomal protein S18-alanine N-acetyltransferase [Acidimicrobiales bacterium]|jgi:ribosomal-protein-alanine N-acetyltransferase|nr:ribosomal protein S18-alanine N-acetyltransferase [Acidimicrobiales bacterium]